MQQKRHFSSFWWREIKVQFCFKINNFIYYLFQYTKLPNTLKGCWNFEFKGIILHFWCHWGSLSCFPPPHLETFEQYSRTQPALLWRKQNKSQAASVLQPAQREKKKNTSRTNTSFRIHCDVQPWKTQITAAITSIMWRKTGCLALTLFLLAESHVPTNSRSGP